MKYLLLLPMSFLLNYCLAQDHLIGGGCDGCELMYLGMPKEISHVGKSPAWDGPGQKLLITGTVFNLDGTTPAQNVIVYYWQTDNSGHYPNQNNLDPLVKRHGYVRGWVKSDSHGKYEIYTIRPAAYPNRNIPAHIHLSIKEPDIKDEYYVDGLEFDDDSLLTSEYREKHENRGGSGVLRTLTTPEMHIAEHNIILGLNIPNYSESLNRPISSGQEIGEDFHSITPQHVWGNDKNTKTCPVCRYGRYFGIMYFINQLQQPETEKWLLFFEQLSQKWGVQLKVYLIFGNAQNYGISQTKKELDKLGKKLNLKHIALTYVPHFNDKASDIYKAKINPEAENTIMLYKNRSIINKYINLDANQTNFNKLSIFLKQNSGYFNLKESWKQ